MTTRHVATRDEQSFSAALKAATWGEHQAAERSPFMDALMGGGVTREGYAGLLAQQLFAYRIIEDAAVAMASDPIAGPFVCSELARVPSLETDLAALLGPHWSDRVAPTVATQAYCDRLAEVCHTWPGGFVAHHYTRYLGDLSGGQFIGRVVRRALDIDERSGAAFFAFPGIPDAKAFKERYRDHLDAAPWEGAERDRVIDEIRLAYRMNTAVLADLDPAGGR